MRREQRTQLSFAERVLPASAINGLERIRRKESARGRFEGVPLGLVGVVDGERGGDRRSVPAARYQRDAPWMIFITPMAISAPGLPQP
jgi:hypothetical protein